jgi:hypothetical protein
MGNITVGSVYKAVKETFERELHQEAVISMKKGG